LNTIRATHVCKVEGCFQTLPNAASVVDS